MPGWTAGRIASAAPGIADFAGTHIGGLAGIAPTGREVRVSYAVVYDLRGDQISELRIYFPMALLMEQLTG